MSLQERAGPEAKHWTMRAPMLALQNPDPSLGLPRGIALQPTLFIRNTTAKNITADLSLTWRGDSGKGQVNLPQLQLAPFATQQVQIGSTLLQIPNKIPQNAHWGLVTLTTDALPDDLVAFATSIDSSGRYNLATRFAGGIGGHFTGGEWDLDANHNAIAAITNIGSKPTNALLTLHYDNGKKSYELQQTIAPGDQMWVNLAQLVRNRVADRNGNTLPADVSSVTYQVQDLAPGSHGLMANALALDASFGFQVLPPILRCCGANQPVWEPGLFNLLPGASADGQIWGVDQCTGEPINLTPDFNAWWSDNSGVATVTSQQVHGVTAGSADAWASGWVTEGNAAYCTVVHEQPSAPINVLQFNVAYSDYIPVDHISGPSYCYYQGQSNDLIYMGDANRGTYRVTESVDTEPDANPTYWGFFPDTGQTRNYGAQSPKNGSTLSSLDEDGVANDCYLWNNSGKASTSGLLYDVSNPYAHQSQVHYDGSASNPLESQLGAIQWDMRTLIDTSNPSAPTALVNYNHTCYPSHQIKVNGKVVYLYTPPSNSLTYITGCLVFNGNNKIVGQQSTPTQVPPY